MDTNDRKALRKAAERLTYLAIEIESGAPSKSEIPLNRRVNDLLAEFDHFKRVIANFDGIEKL